MKLHSFLSLFFNHVFIILKTNIATYEYVSQLDVCADECFLFEAISLMAINR